jgi:hypothetical protein
MDEAAQYRYAYGTGPEPRSHRIPREPVTARPYLTEPVAAGGRRAYFRCPAGHRWQAVYQAETVRAA